MNSLPQEQYKMETARKLFYESIDKAYEYLNSYFKHIANPPGIMYWNYVKGEMMMYKEEEALKTLFPNEQRTITKVKKDKDGNESIEKFKIRLKEDWFNKSIIYERTTNIKEPILFEYKDTPHLNMFRGIDKNLDQKVSEMSENTREGIFHIWKHVKEVLCSDDEIAFKYVHNWICNAVCFKRNYAALYFRSNQGTGKNTFTDFLVNKVLSPNIAVSTEDPDVMGVYNSILEGKVLLVLEEMRSSDKYDWASHSGSLKTMITESRITIKEKYIKACPVENYLNIIINTNKNAIKLEGTDRRYFVANVSDKRMGDMEYFKNLHDKYLNKEDVALGFYRYCHENIDKDFSPREIPMTKNKLTGIAENLNSVLMCIKDSYLLKKKDLTCKFSDFRTVYEAYCMKNKLTTLRKEVISRIFEDNSIKKKTGHANVLFCNMTYEELKQLYEKRHWIHETDEFIEDADKKVNNDFEDKDDLIIKEQKSIIEQKDKEIEELKKQIEELKSQQKLTYTNLFDDEITLDKKDVPTNFNLPKLAKMIEEDKKPKPKEIEIIHKKTKKVEPKKVEPKKELIEEDEDLFMVII